MFTIENTEFTDLLVVEGVVRPVNTSTIICPREVDGTIVYLAEDGSFVKEGDIICVIEDKNIENEYEEGLLNLETAIADLNKTQADLAMQFALLQAEVSRNQADSDLAQMDSLQLLYLTPNQRRIRELELQQGALNRLKLESRLRNLEVIQQSEIRKQEMAIQRRRSVLNKRLEQMEGLTLRAPADGMVLRTTHWATRTTITEGDPAWENMPLLSLPELYPMKVVIQANETDFKRMQVGDPVTFHFDAMPENIAWGTIIRKAPVGTPINRNSKVRLFEVEASIDSSLTTPPPGLSTRGSITLRKVENTIVIPQISVFEADSSKVVFVKKGNYYEQRQIITAESSPKMIVVTQGLSEGDVISLIRPSEKRIKEFTRLYQLEGEK